jgi:hypothetical protein
VLLWLFKSLDLSYSRNPVDWVLLISIGPTPTEWVEGNRSKFNQAGHRDIVLFNWASGSGSIPATLCHLQIGAQSLHPWSQLQLSCQFPWEEASSSWLPPSASQAFLLPSGQATYPHQETPFSLLLMGTSSSPLSADDYFFSAAEGPATGWALQCEMKLFF